LTPRAAALAISLVALFATSAAEAQNVRFVRTNGNDANACTLAQPCRTLQRGIQAAPVRGEVRLLDSGAFGAGVTIAKSLTISGNGNTLILSGSGDDITINNAAARVVLRDLVLTGLGAGNAGIFVTAAASLHVVACEVERFPSSGLRIFDGSPELFVTDSIFRNNGAGMRVESNTSSRVTVDRSHFENNSTSGATIDGAQANVTRSTFSGNDNDGLGVGSGTTISIAWSTAANNGSSGFSVLDSDVQLESSVARGNATGVFVVFGTGVASISNMTVTDNNLGIRNFATVRTRGNNRVLGNADDFDGGGTTTPLGGT
jgi:hypothetical protein